MKKSGRSLEERRAADALRKRNKRAADKASKNEGNNVKMSKNDNSAPKNLESEKLPKNDNFAPKDVESEKMPKNDNSAQNFLKSSAIY
jgi:hypothetical protein